MFKTTPYKRLDAISLQNIKLKNHEIFAFFSAFNWCDNVRLLQARSKSNLANFLIIATIKWKLPALQRRSVPGFSEVNAIWRFLTYF